MSRTGTPRRNFLGNFVALGKFCRDPGYMYIGKVLKFLVMSSRGSSTRHYLLGNSVAVTKFPSDQISCDTRPIFCRLRGVSRHTPSFYNIAMRIYSRLVRARRSG